MSDNQFLIMLVDDNVASLMDARSILASHYNICTATSAADMLEMLKIQHPNLILIDTDMPGINGFEAVEMLQKDPNVMNIPILFLVENYDLAQSQERLNSTAIGYICKPFFGPVLIKRIETQLFLAAQQVAIESQQREFQNFSSNLQKMVRDMSVLIEAESQRVWQLQTAIISVMAEMVECRDDVTGGHIERTRRGVGILLRDIQEKHIYVEQTLDWNVEMVLQASQLHDVGKIYISDTILQKPGKLTEEEFNIMKQHTDYGNTIIDRIEAYTHPNELTRHAKIFAGFHHEKWDGSGYPLGLNGQDIPLQGRLMAIADVYDALISPRPYKGSLSHEETVSIIKKGKTTHFDPVLVEVFLSVADEFKQTYETVRGESLKWLYN
ncbi:MAG: response regulator [Treponema sp.]|jgi:putative two-component system response regulator|nr:response regulator [Treponema sp.]